MCDRRYVTGPILWTHFEVVANNRTTNQTAYLPVRSLGYDRGGPIGPIGPVMGVHRTQNVEQYLPGLTTLGHSLWETGNYRFGSGGTAILCKNLRSFEIACKSSQEL